MAANNNKTTEVFAGLVERVTFHNEDNGFCVPRVTARGTREPARRPSDRYRNSRRSDRAESARDLTLDGI